MLDYGSEMFSVRSGEALEQFNTDYSSDFELLIPLLESASWIAFFLKYTLLNDFKLNYSTFWLRSVYAQQVFNLC